MAKYNNVVVKDNSANLTKKNDIVTVESTSGDVVINTRRGGSDILYFKDVNDISDLEFKHSADTKDLIITVSKSQTITVNNYFSNVDGTSTKSTIKNIRLADDKQYSIIGNGLVSTDGITFNQNKKGVVSGTVFNDIIDKSDVEITYGKNNKGLTINAGYGNDVITGSKNNDVIVGGKGNNTINFDFTNGFGKDVVKLTKGENLNLAFTKDGSNISYNDSNISYTKSGNDLVITYLGDSNNSVTIQKYFKNTGANVFFNDVLLSEKFRDDIVVSISGRKNIYGTSYNDEITASRGNDKIVAGKGDDIIHTNGGTDTIYFSGDYGNDVVDATSTKKVTLNIKNFDGENFDVQEDSNNKTLIYTSDDGSNSIQYKEFGGNDTADLYIKSGKKTYHVTNSAEDVDNYSSKSNNIAFLENNVEEYKGSKNTKLTNYIYADGETKFNYNGSNDKYIANGANDNEYNVSLNTKTKLEITDNGGSSDTLNLNSAIDDAVLLFDVDKDSNLSTDSDLIFVQRKQFNYKNIKNFIKTESLSGSIILNDYFDSGAIESVKSNSTDVNMTAWIQNVVKNVGEWLRANGKYSTVVECLQKGKKSEINQLLGIFKSASYTTTIDNSYNNDVYFDKNFSDMVLSKDGDDLIISSNDTVLNTVSGYFNAENIKEFYAQNDSGVLSKYEYGVGDARITIKSENGVFNGTNFDDEITVTSGLETVNLNGGNDVVNFKEGYNGQKEITTSTNSNDTFVFENKTLNELLYSSTAYDADPFIVKQGSDLKIGKSTDDVRDNIEDGMNVITVKDFSNKKNKVTIKALDGSIDVISNNSGTINGTEKNEIIIGTDKNDVITNGGGNDFVYLGNGDDEFNIVSSKDKTSGDVDYSSVYSEMGNDTYNTDMTSGLYIEDLGGNDVLNINNTDITNLKCIFDVKSSLYTDYNFYTDLFMVDSNEFMSIAMGLASSLGSSMTASDAMKSLQGKFGYAWIDDFYSDDQKIETINLNGKDITTAFDYTNSETTSNIGEIYQNIATFLTANNYQTAWEVIDKQSKRDMLSLFMLYNGYSLNDVSNQSSMTSNMGGNLS